MANLTGKKQAFQVDQTDSTAAIVDISAHVTSVSISGDQSVLEDSALQDDERTFLHGLAGATLSVQGWANTTTEGIYGPLVGNRTSKTKTVDFGLNSTMRLNGETLITNVQFQGAPDTVATFSADHTFTGVINRTATALS